MVAWWVVRGVMGGVVCDTWRVLLYGYVTRVLYWSVKAAILNCCCSLSSVEPCLSGRKGHPAKVLVALAARGFESL